MTVLVRNNVRVGGSGKVQMLFAHGFGCDQNMWRFVAPAFVDDYQLVTFDHVGCGGSDLRAYDRHRYSTLSGYARDVIQICEALKLARAVFVGHSVSAMIGVLAARMDPGRFERLVMICPSARYVNDDGTTNSATATSC
jgi:sigma-B regulation protein RsbQ